MTSPFQALPSVERILSDERVRQLIEAYSRQVVTTLVRSHLDSARKTIAGGGSPPEFDDLVEAVESQASEQWTSWPNHVINATGVILHTNLGRAPLSRESAEAMQRAAFGYSDLELDLESGRRGSRQAHISRLVCEVTGAEAAMVVNNNASAVMLGLAAIAVGKEVIVSRGEAVEIGGGFRIPDVLEQSGARLVEVGTTNRTYARDFEAAITPDTAAILSVHASNFKVIGFTSAPKLSELVEVGARRNVPVLHDLGSGCLFDTTEYGLAYEPRPQDSVEAGVGLGFFSGDKLLGGPQAGIIIGKKDLVDVVARHPLARAVRIDKLSMAALAATLLHYIRDEALEKVPVWRMMAMTAAEIEVRAGKWQGALGEGASVVEARSAIGGGSLPGESLPSWCVAVDCAERAGGADGLAKRLRSGDTPVIARIEDERVLLDPRTVLPEEEEQLLDMVGQALSEGSGG
ncbi:MAG: L-seryl-tRNA(Sec) selenium transferase [Chloroflexi bacterium]|nr:L-seryl-tRNA(Sec) selenium transferase [Chloroflexota bacterium]